MYKVTSKLQSRTGIQFDDINHFIDVHGPVGTLHPLVIGSSLVLNPDNTVTKELVYVTEEDLMEHHNLREDDTTDHQLDIEIIERAQI